MSEKNLRTSHPADRGGVRAFVMTKGKTPHRGNKSNKNEVPDTCMTRPMPEPIAPPVGPG